MSTPYWKQAIASLPPEVRERHAGELAGAQRVCEMIDLAIEAWGLVRLVIARGCLAAARGLRVAARLFDNAAEHISLRH